MDRTLVVIGGGELRLGETLPIDGYICDLAKSRAGDRRAVALFIGTASKDCMPYYNTFHKVYTGVYGLKTDVALVARGEYDFEKLKGKFEKADVIYVGGGDTVYMLAKWRETGLDKLILSAYERGVILCGLSAGAICWFRHMYTDGLMTEGVSDKYEITTALGVLSGAACPHFNERKPDFLEAAKKNDEISEWYCLENCSALRFENEILKEGVSCGGKAYFATKRESEVDFTEISTVDLRENN